MAALFFWDMSQFPHNGIVLPFLQPTRSEHLVFRRTGGSHTLQSDNLLFHAKKEKNKKENGCLIFHYSVFLDGKKEKKPLQPSHLKWHEAGGQIRRKQRLAIRLSITRGTGVWGLHTNKRAAGGGDVTFDRLVLTGWANILHSVGWRKDVRWSQNEMGGFPDTCPMVGGKGWGSIK